MTKKILYVMGELGAVLLFLAWVLSGCSMAPVQPIGKDWGVCLEHGITDPQNCDAAYDGGSFPPKDGQPWIGPSSRRAPEPVMVAQVTEAERERVRQWYKAWLLEREGPIPEPVRPSPPPIWYGPAYSPEPRPAPARSNPFLDGSYQRDQQLEDQGRRLRDLERQQEAERFNRSMRPPRY